MKFTKESSLLLGLSKKEYVILQVLEDAEILTVAELSRKTHIPRMTLYPIIKRLAKRSFLHLSKKGHNTFIRTTNETERAAFEQTLRDLFKLERNDKTEVRVGSLACEILTGRENIVKTYSSISQLSPFERVYAIQPNKSAVNVFKKMKLEKIAKVCQEIKDNKVIVDAILQDNSLGQWLKDLKMNKIDPKEVIKTLDAFGGRMADTTYVPREYFDFDSEFWMYRDTLVIFNWKEEVVIKIRNSDIIGIFKHLYLLAKYAGRKADQNAMIQKYFSDIGVRKLK